MFTMKIQLYIAFFILLIVCGILYKKITTHNDNTDEMICVKIKHNLDKSPNPILWIFVPYELNPRTWESFGSRNTYELGQPYLTHTVKSIIKNSADNFNVILIDDKSFAKIIPNWTIELSKLQDPIKKNIRSLAMAKLLYLYGGMVVPISFLAMEPLIHLYTRGIKNGGIFMCETMNRTLSSNQTPFVPSIEFMGAEKNNNDVSKLINYLQVHISTDNTEDTKFVGGVGEFMKNNITIVDGMYIGTKTVDTKPILIDDLLSDNFINFYEGMFGIWLPSEDILNRVQYNWFATMSEEDILDGTFILSKYFILTK